MDVWQREVKPRFMKEDVDVQQQAKALIPVADQLSPLADLRPDLAGIPSGYGARQRAVYRLMNVDWSTTLTGSREVSEKVANLLQKRFTRLEDAWASQTSQIPSVEVTTTYYRWHNEGIKYLAEGLRRMARQAVAAVEKSGLPGPNAPLPYEYVEPRKMERLYSLITERVDYQPPTHIVLHGLSGVGKTTLALAFAKSEIVDRNFQDGVLWLDGNADDLIEEARQEVSNAYGMTGKMQRKDWEKWIQPYDRRLLIIIDDLADVKRLRDFLKQGLGPQVTVLVTTQRGAEVVGEMGRFFREEDIAELEITGLGEKKGHRFVEKVLGRELKETELAVVAEVGGIVGWHPEGLRLAAQMARDDLLTWRDVLSDLRDVEESTVLYRLERWVIRHWRRMESQEREQAQRLLDAMERGGPFGALFASAAWNVEIGQARVRLLRMERDGLIERMAGHPVEYWWSEVGEQWRALPIVYRVRGRSGSSDEGAEWWRSVARRVERSFGLSGRMRKRFPKMPTALGVVGAGGLLAFSPLKAVGEGFLLLGELVGSGQDWKLRWNDWTIINKVESHLKDHWERAGWQPTEELWMLYKRNNLLIYLIFLIQLSVLATLFLLQKQTFFVDLMALIFVSGAGLAVSYRGAWRVWVACLYGVHTWDLELMLRVSLWLTQRLSWISSMQEDQDMLQEVLMRVRGERVD